MIPGPSVWLALAAVFAANAGLAVPAASPPPLPDPRPHLATLLLAGDDAAALEATEKTLSTDPTAASQGFDFTRADILDRLGRPREAADAFAFAFARGPIELRPHARYRLALAQQRLGHPEVAAGLVATLLAEAPPESLLPPAMRLLGATIGAGGDCRVLGGLAPQRLKAPERRELSFIQATCRERQGDADAAARAYLALLRDDLDDEVALNAAQRLADLGGSTFDQQVDRFLGLTFHHHREFDRATLHLESALRLDAAADGDGGGAFDARYALLRSHFWQNRLRAAALGFGGLADDALDAPRRSLALFQRGRAHELLGDDTAASADFRRAYLAEPRGENAAPALLSALRVDWRRGLKAEAVALLDVLSTQSAWRSALARAASFLASSDIARGHGERAATWLDRAARAGAAADEVEYWRGRLAEIKGQPAGAAAAYVEALRAAPFGPFARPSRERLGAPALAPAVKALAARLVAGRTFEDQRGLTLLLEPRDPRLVAARQTLRAALASDPRTALFLDLTPAAPASWPLWQAPLRGPEDRLLGLGVWSEGGSAAGRQFPVDHPALALAGGAVMARGGEARRSLAWIETLALRVPARIPPDLVSPTLRRALYPHPYRALVEREARRRGVDPHLLTAILREESRFDPRALSGASARGLAQFVLPTARELGTRAGFPSLRPDDLERPEVSIALAALYLSDLEKRVGWLPQVVAAYNAGERQAELWRRDCAGDDPAEYISKVSFNDTKLYVARVLTSREQYADLYPGEK